jgi:hypothetical protein
VTPPDWLKVHTILVFFSSYTSTILIILPRMFLRGVSDTLVKKNLGVNESVFLL